MTVSQAAYLMQGCGGGGGGSYPSCHSGEASSSTAAKVIYSLSASAHQCIMLNPYHDTKIVYSLNQSSCGSTDD